MNIEVNKKDLYWSYLARFFQLASSVLLLPVILKMVSSEELAIWYVFIAISTFVMLLDFGLSPTILRYTTYVFSGVGVLKKEGIEEVGCDGKIDYNLLYSLILSIKKIYRFISIVGCVLLFTLGTWYVYSICVKIPNSSEYVIYWLMFSASTCLNLYYLYFFPLIMGSGKQSKQYQIIIISKSVNLFVTFTGVLMGYGLVALVVGVLISTLVNRYLSYRVFFDKDIKRELDKVKYICNGVDVFKVICNGSYRLGVVSVANFLISNGNIFIVTSFSDLDQVASYGLTNQVLLTLLSVSQIFFGTYIPTFNSLRLKGKNDLLKEKISLAMVISLSLYIMGGVGLLLLGNKLLYILGASTFLLSRDMLFFMLLINLLDFNHNNCATAITTGNIIPHAYPMIISGIMIVLLSWVLYSETNLGLWSVVVSQGIVQVVYNNWIWPYRMKKYMNFSYWNLVGCGIKQIRVLCYDRFKVRI